MKSTIQTTDQIEADLARAEGRATQRTLSACLIERTRDRVLYCATWFRRRPALRHLAERIIGEVTGGGVPNAYKYRAETTNAKIDSDGAVAISRDTAGKEPHGGTMVRLEIGSAETEARAILGCDYTPKRATAEERSIRRVLEMRAIEAAAFADDTRALLRKHLPGYSLARRWSDSASNLYEVIRKQERRADLSQRTRAALRGYRSLSFSPPLPGVGAAPARLRRLTTGEVRRPCDLGYEIRVDASARPGFDGLANHLMAASRVANAARHIEL